MALRSVEDARAEAVKRMKILELREVVSRVFKEDGTVYKSDDLGFLWNLTEEEQAQVERFEEERNAIVYYIVHQRTDAGELYSLLFVDLEDETWRLDRESLEKGRSIAYVLNAAIPEYSELGMIGIEESIGGLVRTW